MKKAAIQGMLVVAGLLTVMQACQEQSKDHFQQSAGGLKYCFLLENPQARKASIGDIMTMVVKYTNYKDSVLFNTQHSGNPTGTIQIRLVEPSYKGDIVEGFAMMHEGDSAIFKTSADSFFAKIIQQPLPPFIPPSSDLTFYVKVIRIQSMEEIQRQMEEEAKMKSAEEDSLIKQYLSVNKINVSPTQTGLYYLLLKKGNGKKAESGKTVKVHYTGTLLDGTKFDSSYDRGQPIEFVLGQGMVIAGWEEGIAMMNEGGKAKLIIPSKLAYGPQQRGEIIKPYSTLVFEVELIEVK